LDYKIIGLIIGIIITIGVVGYTVSDFDKNEVIEENTESLEANELNDSMNETKSPAEEKIDDIIEDMTNKTDELEYKPKPRIWQSSGPFEIDRKEYILGEKIFLRINYLEPTEKGQVAVMRPLNDTHYSVYQTVPFDGSKPRTFNVYFEPDLSKQKEICTKEDLIGKWAIVFRGTDYENLYFNVTEQILPGDEDSYEPVC